MLDARQETDLQAAHNDIIKQSDGLTLIRTCHYGLEGSDVTRVSGLAGVLTLLAEGLLPAEASWQE